MRVATMSRQTKRDYLRLCPEKRRKKNSGSEELKYKLIFSNNLKCFAMDTPKKINGVRILM